MKLATDVWRGAVERAEEINFIKGRWNHRYRHMRAKRNLGEAALATVVCLLLGAQGANSFSLVVLPRHCNCKFLRTGLTLVAQDLASSWPSEKACIGGGLFGSNLRLFPAVKRWRCGYGEGGRNSGGNGNGGGRGNGDGTHEGWDAEGDDDAKMLPMPYIAFGITDTLEKLSKHIKSPPVKVRVPCKRLVAGYMSLAIYCSCRVRHSPPSLFGLLGSEHLGI